MGTASSRRARFSLRALRDTATVAVIAACLLAAGLTSVALAVDIRWIAADLASGSASGAELEPPAAVPAGSGECRDCHPRQCDALAASAHAVLGCARCHDRHVADGSAEPRSRVPGLCFQCHSDLGDATHNHTADGSYYDETASRPLTCTSSCHDPMGTRHPFMLRPAYGDEGAGQDAVCVGCHGGVGVEE